LFGVACAFVRALLALGAPFMLAAALALALGGGSAA
jgi:hypothetical protein